MSYFHWETKIIELLGIAIITMRYKEAYAEGNDLLTSCILEGSVALRIFKFI